MSEPRREGQAVMRRRRHAVCDFAPDLTPYLTTHDANTGMDDDAIWTLLTRYLAGETSEEEDRKVEAWLREDPSHRETLAHLQRIWEVSGVPRSDDRPSAEELQADRERLLQSIHEPTPPMRPDRQPRRRRASPAARVLNPRTAGVVAALLLLVAAGVVWMQGGLKGSDAPPTPFETVATARGERATVRLSDSTRVRLSVDSELRVPEAFGADERTVVLRGEAYFEVTPDPDRPFIVQSGAARVRVLGTAFGVTAYPDEQTVQVVVREGRVAMEPDGSGLDESKAGPGATLEQNDLGVLDGATSRLTTRRVNADAYLSWIENRLTFHNAPLPEVARRLERWYDVDVKLRGSTLSDRRLTASFDSASVGSVAEVIATTLGIHHRVDEAAVVFTTVEPAPDDAP